MSPADWRKQGSSSAFRSSTLWSWAGPPGSRYWSRQEHGHAKQAGLSEGSPVVRESGPTETLEPTYACPNCGGTDIEHLDWVRTNTGELVGGNYGGSESDNYCPSCEEQGNYPHFKWAVEARRVRAAARELLEHFDEELCAHGGEGGPFSKDVAPFAELVGEVARDFVATDELSVEEALSRLLREAIELDEVHYAVAAREFRSALKADLDLLRDHPEYRPIWAELLTPPASKTTKE